MTLPLHGITALEFSQYLAGPYAGLRLADLGARVIKVERPKGGDACRQLATKNMFVDGDSLVFHTINRNKESYAANLKNPEDLERVKDLIKCADVMTHNFRPGVMEKIGLDHETVRAINPSIVYCEVSGYGKEGPWVKKPGQDLLAQAVSGLTWLTGNEENGPIPFGMAVGDMLCGTHLAQGILAGLYHRATTNQGSHIEVSLLESLLDLQVEALTTSFNQNNALPQRAKSPHAHAYLNAPYGTFATQNGYIAIAMGNIDVLSELLELPSLSTFSDSKADAQNEHLSKRDEINKLLSQHFATKTTKHWLSILEPADYWCSDVFDYATMMSHQGYTTLDMAQTVGRPNGQKVTTLRCPIRINGERLFNDTAAPLLGNATHSLNEDILDPGSRLHTNTLTQRCANQALANNDVEEPCSHLPLKGVTVVDFSQFLSGPSASLRLADLGARVIKIEQPNTGDIARHLYVNGTADVADSSFFRAINRNKDSVCVDLKDPVQRNSLTALLSNADVVMHNFRPDVAKRLQLDYPNIKKINKRVVYGEISGYGKIGPWANKPGQDLLLQSLSGISWLSGDQNMGPIPMGMPVVDVFAGAQLAQGLLALLIQRQLSGEGGCAEVVMFESALDFQFEPLTVYFQDGAQEPLRTETNGAHAYLGAPYGLYATQDGYLALAMANITQLGELLNCEALSHYPEPASWFDQRDAIKLQLANHLQQQTTKEWLAILEPADIWCAKVHNWDELRATQAYTCLNFEQQVSNSQGEQYRTTRCPIRFNQQTLTSEKGAPSLGEHNSNWLS